MHCPAVVQLSPHNQRVIYGAGVLFGVSVYSTSFIGGHCATRTCLSSKKLCNLMSLLL